MPMEQSSCKESIETNRVQIRVLPSEFSVNNESLSLVRALYFSPHVFKFSFSTGALEYAMGDAHMPIQARLNQALHKLSHSLYTLIIFINQTLHVVVFVAARCEGPVYRRVSLRCNVRVMHGYAYPTEDPECYKIFEKNESEQLAFGA
ncbi:hypothetical protein IGI04_035849, partial [Brassica rapa subsp. trilocularis]